MKGCDLCKSAGARMYCESDQASLCWDCDGKVHSANFLVARHSRSLLCHVCQSPTPWSASGERLGRTVSLCEGCVEGCGGVKEEGNRGDNDEESDGGYDGEEEEDDEEEEIGGDDEEGENQVVPWSSTQPPPPSDASSSSSESSSRLCYGGRAVSLMQLRENAVDLSCDGDDHSCSSAHRYNNSPVASRYSETVVESLRPLKRQRTELSGTSNAEILETIVEICSKSKMPASSRMP